MSFNACFHVHNLQSVLFDPYTGLYHNIKGITGADTDVGGDSCIFCPKKDFRSITDTAYYVCRLQIVNSLYGNTHSTPVHITNDKI